MYSDLLQQAIALRKKGEFDESRKILFSLMDSTGADGSIYLNIAWSYDNQGMEQTALDYYLLSLGETLSDEDKFEATFGLACTYRCLGHLHKAEPLFNQLRQDYPDASEVIPFYALCLSALDRKDDAIRLLFNLILESPPTEAIRSYKTALAEYVKAEDPGTP